MILFKEADYHLDLHSTSGKSIPFAFCEESVLDLAKNI
jgi:predicted deacylase